MSNGEFKLLVLALLAAHASVLALGLIRRGRLAAPWLTGADAAAVLAWLAFHPAGFHPPIDWPVVALAVFEALVLATAAMAVRGVRWPSVAVWFAFALHLAAAGLAVIFAFTFKINRLI